MSNREFEITYETIKKIYDEFKKERVSPYLVGGICAAIQARKPLYRQNDDIDLMVDIKDLDKVIACLEKIGYSVADRRGIYTQNRVDLDGKFIPANHEIDCSSRDRQKLGVGIFVYERKDGKVYTHSYARHDDKGGNVICSETAMPEELFDLMYSPQEIEFDGTSVRTQSREYTFMTKARGTREKDKLDASVLEPLIGPDERAKIDRIRKLEHRVEKSKIEIDDKGMVVQETKEPRIDEKIAIIINRMLNNFCGQSHQEQKAHVLANDRIKSILSHDSDLRQIMERWEHTDSEDSVAEQAKKIAYEHYFVDKEKETDAQVK